MSALDADNPMPGQILQTVGTFSAEYDGTEEPRYFTRDLDEAAVITSLVDMTPDRPLPERGPNPRQPFTGQHKPVIDLDLPAKLIPSSTPGHFHLYIDKPTHWDNYLKLLEALVLCGIVEPGYVEVAKKRGFTAARLPWIKKDEGL